MIKDQSNNLVLKHQKMRNLLDNIPNRPSKFRTKNWAEENYYLCRKYNTNTQIKLKTSLLMSIT